MRLKNSRFVVPVLFACAALGQTAAEQNVNRVFYLKHAQTVQELQEMATAVRSVTDMGQLSVDNSQKSLVARGTSEQIAAADWLVHALDQPAWTPDQASIPDSGEYRTTGAENIVRVYYIRHAETIQSFQELTTVLRNLTNVRRMFTYNGPRAIAARGTADQLALADWLFPQVDQPANAPDSSGQATSREFRVPGGSGDTVRVFRLPNIAKPQEFQEAATLIRSLGEIRMLFTYNGPRMMAMRGTSGQAAVAGWLVSELNDPGDPQTPHVYHVTGSNVDDVVRVFYLPATETVENFQEVAGQIRSATQARRLFTYTPKRAIALRGSLDRIATAERILTGQQNAQ